MWVQVDALEKRGVVLAGWRGREAKKERERDGSHRMPQAVNGLASNM
jgi:hypothetical protein